MPNTVWYTLVNLDHANHSTTRPCPARLACVHFPSGPIISRYDVPESNLKPVL